MSGLDSFIAEIMSDVLRPDEFTARQVYEKQRDAGGQKTLDSVRGLLQRMENQGNLKARRIILNGKITAAYSVP